MREALAEKKRVLGRISWGAGRGESGSVDANRPTIGLYSQGTMRGCQVREGV